jgi:hypothetical protein
VASAIEGALQGLGESFPYDSDLYSGGGLGVADSSAGNLRWGTAGSGEEIRLGNVNRTGSKYGAGALACEPATVNLLPADSRDAESAPSGYNAVSGAGLAADTTFYVQGTKSVEVTAAGAGEGVRTDNASVATATKYWGSVYVYAAATVAVTVTLQENSGATVIGSQAISLAGGKWYRVEVSGTTTGAATTLGLQVAATSGALTFYCDAFQIEADPSTGIATTWVDGTRANASDLSYSASPVAGSYDLTVAAWVRWGWPTTNPTTKGVLFRAQLSATSVIEIYRKASTSEIWVDLTDSSGTHSTSGTVSSNAWAHIAVVITARADDGSPDVTIYQDGVSIGTGTPTSYPDPTAFTDMWIGQNDGANFFVGSIDDVVVAPYPMTGAQVAAIVAMAKAMPALSKIYVDGDFLSAPDLTALAVGKVDSQPYRDGGVDGTFYNNLRETTFALDLF